MNTDQGRNHASRIGRVRYTLLAVTTLFGLALALANWYLVDPFNVRSLSTPFRYGLTVLAGIGLGWLLRLSILSWLERLAGLRRDTLPPFLALWLIFFLALPLQPAPNRFSSTQLSILVEDQSAPVWIEQILVGGEPFPFERCNESGAWDPLDGLYRVEPGGSASMTCILVQPAGTQVEVVFNSSGDPAHVQAGFDAPLLSFDLNVGTGLHAVRTSFTLPRKFGAEIAVFLRIVDALALLVLLTGILMLKPLQRPVAILGILSSWFEETTPRIRIFALISCGLSILLTAFLLLPTVLDRPSSPQLQRVNPQSSPNIIFILVDALSADDMSLFGYPLSTTPNLEKITQDWMVYSNAQSPLTCTVAAMPTFMTGRYPYLNDFTFPGTHGTGQSGWANVPQTLRSAGYQTWWSGYLSPGFYHLSGFERSACRPDDALHTLLSRSRFQVRAISKTSFPFLPYTLDQLDLAEEGREDFNRCVETTSLEQVLQSDQVQQPFFIYYHYRGVHGIPYPAGDSLGAFLPLADGMFSQNGQHGAYGPYDLANQASVDRLRLRYAEAIVDQDKKIGDLIAEIKQLGLYDSSLIIITADHGQSFNNGISSHCTSLISRAETHVPLLIKFPNQTVGARIDALVSTVDLAPTILSAAGFATPLSWFDGIALQSITETDTDGRIVFSRRSLVSSDVLTDLAVSDGRLRLVNRRDQLYLFDITQDPLETVNLLDQPATASLPETQRLRQALDNFLMRQSALLAGKDILSAPALFP